MKKFFLLSTFVLTVMISSTALAANWVEIDSCDIGDGMKLNVYVAKDSIERGTHSKQFNFTREDGFSAVVKIEVTGVPESDDAVIINLVGFYVENGVRKYCLLDTLDEQGNLVADGSSEIEPTNVDTDGEVWAKVYDYVQKNLP